MNHFIDLIGRNSSFHSSMPSIQSFSRYISHLPQDFDLFCIFYFDLFLPFRFLLFFRY